MGIIVELFAGAPESADVVTAESPLPLLVGSLSVNSHAVGELFDAMRTTDLVGLLGDGSDPHRSVTFACHEVPGLRAQIAPWANGSLELLVDAQIALEDAIAECEWLKRSLLITAT